MSERQSLIEARSGRRVTKAEFARIADEIRGVAERAGVTCYVDSRRQQVLILGGRYV